MFKAAIEFFLSLFIIGLFVPQTSRLNLLLRKMFETGFFRNWREAKKVLLILSWGGILVFVVTNYLISWVFFS